MIRLRKLFPRILQLMGVMIILLMVIMTFPFISEKRLTQTRWCAWAIREAHFQFDKTGEFSYEVPIVAEFDGYTVDGKGTWEKRGMAIWIFTDRDLDHDEKGGFIIVPMLGGRAMWSIDDFFLAGVPVLPVWYAC